MVIVSVEINKCWTLQHKYHVLKRVLNAVHIVKPPCIRLLPSSRSLLFDFDSIEISKFNFSKN